MPESQEASPRKHTGVGRISKKLMDLNVLPGVEQIDQRNGDHTMTTAEAAHFYCNHARNRTGIIGPRQWSSDEEVNKLWEKYGQPLPNGTDPLDPVFRIVWDRDARDPADFCEARHHDTGPDPL